MYNDFVSLPEEGLRIGEFARHVGVSAAVLSAAEAARAPRASARPSGGLPENAAERLLTTIHDYDEGAQNEVGAARRRSDHRRR